MLSLTYGILKSQTHKISQNGGYQMLGGGGQERCCLRIQICNQQITKSQSSNAQHSDYREPCCVVNINLAKTLDLNCSHHKKAIIICDVIEILASTNQNVIRLKLTQCYMTTIPQQKRERGSLSFSDAHSNIH